MTIGDNIKKARLKAGLTQKQLGELSGMADSAIRRYENNRANPKKQTIEKISEALKINPTSLYYSSEELEALEILERAINNPNKQHDLLFILNACFGALLRQKSTSKTKITLRDDSFIVWIDDTKIYDIKQDAFTEMGNEVFDYFKTQLNKYIEDGAVKKIDKTL